MQVFPIQGWGWFITLIPWLGLVPRQSSSGHKQVLLSISKRGDRYLRTLLIHGARSALSHYKNTDSDYGRWLTTKKEKLNFNKAAVALANKNARIIWSLLNTGIVIIKWLLLDTQCQVDSLIETKYHKFATVDLDDDYQFKLTLLKPVTWHDLSRSWY